ncbi:MAG: PD-(D/E)XK nuclease domain-containing protein, partial [Lachnospiraceae bacterium]|nr:PD-(D/E)XK nuclease domain-containing protein [Lachnospiraceae bacterium]
IDLVTTFSESQSSAGLWGLLLNAGYVTIEKKIKFNRFKLRIPNEEVKSEFQKIVAEYIRVNENALEELFEALNEKNIDEFIRIYEDIICNCTSSFDAADKENSYHMLMLGMSIYLEPRFNVESNRERGKGRSDIFIYAKHEGDLNVIIEFKYEKKKEKNDNKLLTEKAKEALKQIKDNKYYSDMNGEVLILGIAHNVKNVVILHEFVQNESKF